MPLRNEAEPTPPKVQASELGPLGEVGTSRTTFLRRVAVGLAASIPVLRAVAAPNRAQAVGWLPCLNYFCEATYLMCICGTLFLIEECRDATHRHYFCHELWIVVGEC